MARPTRDGARPLDAAVALLETRFHPVAVLLYGSRASDRASSASDTDLGLLLGKASPDPFEVSAARTDVEDVLGAPVDLVILDSANPILRMEVLRNHEVLRCRDPEALESFTVRTVMEYFDLKQVRAPIERALLKGDAS